MCARQGALLGSESLPGAVSSGTPHLSQGVYREVESEGVNDESVVVNHAVSRLANRQRVTAMMYDLTLLKILR